MQTLDLGHVKIVSNPETPPPPVSAGYRPSARTQLVSLSEAQRSAGFPVLQPSYLPSPALRLGRVLRDAPISSNPDIVANVTLVYSESAMRWIALTQWRQGAITKMEIPFAIVATEIGGRPAATYAQEINPQGRPDTQLNLFRAAWETGGILVELRAAGFESDEAIRVAESLG